MLHDINDLRLFVRIATHGSLSAAGREMGLALSVVSKRLAALEARTNTRLILRNTRRMALTDEGTRLFEHARRILAEVDEAEATLAHDRAEPHGLLRLSAPMALGRAHVSPVCRALTQVHPGLSVDLVLTDRITGLIDEGFDAVVRIGMPREAGLVVRKLADNHRVIVGSPAYLAAHGTPLVPQDLADHQCLHQGQGVLWHLVGPDGHGEAVEAGGRLRCNNGEVWHDWALAGAGLAMKSRIDVEEDLRAGRLVQVLPAWRSPPMPVCAVMPSRSLVPLRLRVFLEAMADRLKAD
ncbi:MAG TPA: LysR family transcriptional regulator [Novosphingobium sp.]|nr:LysR family transcriptional regulator [Novosphingobium sp.]